MAPRWQRDTWQPAQAVASVNGDFSLILPPGTVPQVDQSMPSIPRLSFPRGGGAPQSLPVGDIERTADKPRPAPARAAERRTPTTRAAEKGGENRDIPGMAKGGRRFDAVQGGELDYQAGDRERVRGMMEQGASPEGDSSRYAPTRIGDKRTLPPSQVGRYQEGGSRSVSPADTASKTGKPAKRIYLPNPQLITDNLAQDAQGTSLEEFAGPSALPPELMQILMPMLMAQMMGGGMGQGMPMPQQGMPPQMPMGAPPQGMPPGMPPMSGGMSGLSPGMHMMPDGTMMPDDEMQPGWAGRMW